ncbi:secondary thiamine-phosphate synthase enzyme YjbQ [Persephonella sp.]
MLKEGKTKVYTEYITFNTKNRRELIRITERVQEAVRKSGIQEGLCLVSAMHLTASVFIQDDEEGLHQDIWDWLEKLAPFRSDYRHHLTGEDNGDAHLKNLLTHLQIIVPVTDGRLDLGPWQEIFYAEYDGQRPKRVVIKILGI